MIQFIRIYFSMYINLKIILTSNLDHYRSKIFQVLEHDIAEGTLCKKESKYRLDDFYIEILLIYESNKTELYRISSEKFTYCLKLYKIKNNYNNERSILCKLMHKNIIGIHRYANFFSLTRGAILSEYLELEVSFDSINRDFQKIACILFDMMKGIYYLCTNNIIHCDIKGSNIRGKMINNEPVYILIDFDLSESLNIYDSNKKIRVGTYSNMAPEVFEDFYITRKADIYSLGSVGYYLLNNIIEDNFILFLRVLRLKYKCKKYIESEYQKKFVCTFFCPLCKKCRSCELVYNVTTIKIFCFEYKHKGKFYQSLKILNLQNQNSLSCQICKEIQIDKFEIIDTKNYVKYYGLKEYKIIDRAEKIILCKLCLAENDNLLSNLCINQDTNLLQRMSNIKDKNSSDTSLPLSEDPFSSCFKWTSVREKYDFFINLENNYKICILCLKLTFSEYNIILGKEVDNNLNCHLCNKHNSWNYVVFTDKTRESHMCEICKGNNECSVQTLKRINQDIVILEQQNAELVCSKCNQKIYISLLTSKIYAKEFLICTFCVIQEVMKWRVIIKVNGYEKLPCKICKNKGEQKYETMLRYTAYSKLFCNICRNEHLKEIEWRIKAKIKKEKNDTTNDFKNISFLTQRIQTNTRYELSYNLNEYRYKLCQSCINCTTCIFCVNCKMKSKLELLKYNTQKIRKKEFDNKDTCDKIKDFILVCLKDYKERPDIKELIKSEATVNMLKKYYLYDKYIKWLSENENN